MYQGAKVKFFFNPPQTFKAFRLFSSVSTVLSTTKINHFEDLGKTEIVGQRDVLNHVVNDKEV